MQMFKPIFTTVAIAAAFLCSHAASAQAARDSIGIVGSSTVYPFTTTVAEQFGRLGKFKTPKVESTGTGAGVKLFCQGVGVQYPDVVNASRRMNLAEFDSCAKAGVTEIIEVKIGFDGLSIAQDKKGKPMSLTRKQVYLALAKQIPDPANPTSMIANPNKMWSDIDKSLPKVKIEVLGPPPTSGTRDSFHELYLEPVCRSYTWLNTLRSQDERRFKRLCFGIRSDGAYVEAGENDNLIVQKIEANPNALGIFGYSFLEENQAQLRAVKIEGFVPTYETIASNTYPASRPLFIYVKKAHMKVIPGLPEFVDEYVSDKALGAEGYLAERGLVAPPKADLLKARADVKAQKLFRP
jgi:phosphate transport system substrate-binding protein